MEISSSEIEIILNELLARDKKEISLLSIYGSEILFNYNLKDQKLYLKTLPRSWRNFKEKLCNEYLLSRAAEKELPEFGDLSKAIVSFGLLMPEGIDILIEEIKSYLAPVKRMNRRKDF
ncbi:MAG: hypothetical protein GF308_16890 [Candidatus Heimdallarchaeota archaeon]|nr:hypothetical protein [Candidatus Heimdallarchaeota archaeon]